MTFKSKLDPIDSYISKCILQRGSCLGELSLIVVSCGKLLRTDQNEAVSLCPALSSWIMQFSRAFVFYKDIMKLW